MTHMESNNPNQPAPRGHWYRCAWCGARALTRSGQDRSGESTQIDGPKWDNMCRDNAELVASESTTL